MVTPKILTHSNKPSHTRKFSANNCLRDSNLASNSSFDITYFNVKGIVLNQNSERITNRFLYEISMIVRRLGHEDLIS